jgi:hypothetical protein
MDGVVDDIIEDPLMCQFRPEALQCPPGTTNFTSCLTNVQVSAVREAFTDFYGLDGKIIYPRMQPGSELIAEDIYYTTGPFPYSVDWFRYVVYSMLLSRKPPLSQLLILSQTIQIGMLRLSIDLMQKRPLTRTLSIFRLGMGTSPTFELPEGNYVSFNCLDLSTIADSNVSYVSWAGRLHYLL